MTSATLLTLAGLALVDSLSVGTLLIPIWFLTTPGRVRWVRMVTYLATVAAAYLVIGLALVGGARTVLTHVGDAADATGVLIAQLCVGLALAGIGVLSPNRAPSDGASVRLQRWRDSLTSGPGSTRSVIAVALGAVVIEVATMIPYLAATAIIAREAPSRVAAVALVTGYCVIMVAPAIAATIVRVVLHDRVAGPLAWIDRAMTRHARETTLWIAAVVGLYLVGSAATGLGLIDS